MGRLELSAANCTETTARSYWSNKSTGITVNVPSEALLTPHLWGKIPIVFTVKAKPYHETYADFL